jgi:gamma-glutamyltranspeptidase/glutathione hydrolase
MSAFGSSIMLSYSGILMANRMMWFGPLPGGTNSVLGGRRPLCDIFPIIPQAQDGSHTALDTCDGPKIFSAVFQLATFLSDYDITIDEATRHHILDVSGTDQLTVTACTDGTITRKLAHSFPSLIIRLSDVTPNLFALPKITQQEALKRMTEGCFVPSPHSKVSAFSESWWNLRKTSSVGGSKIQHQIVHSTGL